MTRYLIQYEDYDIVIWWARFGPCQRSAPLLDDLRHSTDRSQTNYWWLESKLYECGIIGDETKRHKVSHR
jgi:hypothetical protein